MANPEHLAILKQGVEQWNKWREETRVTWPDLCGARLGGTDLTGADFSNVDFDDADFSMAELRRVNLYRASMTRAGLGNANLSEASMHGAKFCAANLIGANLKSADLNVANLSRAKLNKAFLVETDLNGADLRDADLTEATLRGANLRKANLSGAILSYSDLRGANFRETLLNGTQLTLAFTMATSFLDVDLSVAMDLETMRHQGPSIVSVETIYKSRGKIPEKFLRGCGLRENFIAYMHSLTGQAFEFYSSFISYSSKDQEFAERLYNDLQGNGVRCWFAPHDIQGGRKIHEQLDEAIRLHDKLLLILSEHSMNSPWVKTEILRAQKREAEENREKDPLNRKERLSGAPEESVEKPKRVLFPITLVPWAALEKWEYPISTGIDLAEEIRQYFIPDFSNWKDHDSYQKAFQRLVGDLKAVASG